MDAQEPQAGEKAAAPILREPVSSIDEVTRRWGELKYMSRGQAKYLHDFILKHEIGDILELGFFHGKSTAYMAATLEEQGKGHIVTMDLEVAQRRKPAIQEVLEDLGLSHRVTPIYSHRSFTWELAKQLRLEPRPQFDMCYIDGAHTWDGSGFAFLLVDIMLRPGGWVIFDDIDWSIAKSEVTRGRPMAEYAAYGPEEREAMQVREVWEVLVRERGYTDLSEEKSYHWAIGRKPL